MRINKSLITYTPSSGAGSGTVTSVAMSVPTGFVVSGSPVTSSGTLAVAFASGYALPTTASQSNWDTAYTFVSNFPSQSGQSGKYLKTNGSVLSWAALEIYATTPLVWTAGTSTMSINQASSGASGFLSSTDWSSFNAKLNNPFTTLGDTLYSNASGAALRLPGNTTATQKFLSQTGDGFGNSAAPSWQEISAISIGAVPTSRTLTINGTSYDLSANRTWSVGTVTSVGLSSSTSGVTIGSTPITSSGTITLSIATASSGSNGLLSSTDWSAFNSKLNNPFSALGQMIYSNSAGAAVVVAPNTTTTKKFLAMTGDGTNGAAPVWDTISGIAGSGTASYVAKFTASSTIGNSLIYDTGVYVGVGHTSPSALLDVAGQMILRDNLYMGYGSASEYFMKIGQSRSGNGYAYLDLIGDTTYTGFGARFIRYNSGANSNTSIEHYGTGNLIFKTVNAARIEFQTGSASVGTIESNGNYIVGNAADSGEKLQVNGTAKITSNLAVDTNSLYVDATNNRVGVGTSSPQKLMHLSAANGATVIRMENTDAAVTSGETIGKIEFYGNDTTSGVGAVIDANGGGLTGQVNIDIWAGTNGNVVGGLTAKYTGAINFTPYLSAPTPAAAGDVYYDATSNKLRCYDGTNWNDLF